MTKVDAIRERLRVAGQRRSSAEAERREALDEIAAAMREGKGLIDIKEMAELAGVTRKTAYRLLGNRNEE